MRFRIFDPIVSVEEGMPLCNLGHLFNAYAQRLSALEVSAYPQETLRQYQRLAVGPLGKLPKADRENARVLRAAQERLYCLAVVNNSLHDMHLCVLGACNTLSDLFNLYDGDLHRYAAQERLKQIAEYVSGEEQDMIACMSPEEWAEFQADWEPGAPGEPHRVKYKDDEQSLAPYTITAQLSDYFATLHTHQHIESIGSATPQDFAYFNEVVRDHSQAHKTSHIGELGVYRPNAQGELERQSLAQRVENEVNDELKDKRVAAYFSQILRRMDYAAGLAAALTDTASCQELLTELLSIRDCTDLYEPATLV